MYPPKLLPEKLMFENFAIAWSKAPFTRYTINTLIIVFFTIIGNVLVNSFVAYGFAKIDFAGKKFLFNVILATMMIPGFVTLVPTYVIFSKLQWVIWGRLMMPLVKPVLATVALISFKGAWSDFQGPLLYLSDRAKYTLQLGLQVFKGQGFTEWNYLMAVSFLSMLPILLLFFCFQNYFIEGMNVGGAVK